MATLQAANAAPFPFLRASKLGELLDQSIRLFRRNFLRFIAMVAVVEIPMGLLSLLASLARLVLPASTPPDSVGLAQDPNLGIQYLSQSLVYSGINMLIGVITSLGQFLLVYGLFHAAMCYSVIASYTGEGLSFSAAYRKALHIFPRLAGAMLLAFLIMIPIFIWMVIPCVGWFTGIGLFMFFSMIIVPWITPVIVFEDRPATSSIRRTWDLARKRFWWLIGAVLIMGLLNAAISLGPSALFSTILNAAMPVSTVSLATRTIITGVSSSLVGLIFGLLSVPLYIIMLIKIYIDTRVRTEGLDLVAQAAFAPAPAGAAAISPSQPADTDLLAVLRQAPAAYNPALITWGEVGYFALLSLIFIGGFVVIYAVIAGVMVAVLAAVRPSIP